MSSQVASLMSKKSFIVSVIPQNRLLIHFDGIEKYLVETVFKDDYESLTHCYSWKEINFHIHNTLFDHLHKLSKLQMDGTGHRLKKCHGQHHQGQ